MTNIEVDNISFSYTSERQVLENINLEIEEGDFVCILGESGCGKSSLLRLIAGLETANKGTIWLNGKSINKPLPTTGIVFQKPSLIPWLNVEKNLTLGYKIRNEKNEEEEIHRVLDMVGVKGFNKAKPNELSGGMAQRIAIARALLGGTNLLLMDEPFAAVDALTKLKLQEELQEIWKQSGKTILFITHDIDEAIYLGNRILIMTSFSGKFSNDIKINLDRPRNRDSEAYIKQSIEVKKRLFETIKNKKNE